VIWQWSPAGLATLAAAGLYVSLAAYVWWRRGGTATTALALVLLAAYAAELGAVSLAVKQLWGDVKYVGICLLPPAWLVFVARFSGRGHWVTRRTLVLMALEPIIVLGLLANAATHDLIRFYPPGAASESNPDAEAGPLFWPHLLYIDLVLWACSALFVATLLRASPVYRRASISLIASQFVPWALNLLFNLRIGPFGRVDLAPFAFTACGGVLVWGMYRSRLLAIAPIARSLVFDTITDAVVVRDPLGRVVDVNPAAERLLGSRLSEIIGRSLVELEPAAHRGLTRSWSSARPESREPTSRPRCRSPAGMAPPSDRWWSCAMSPSTVRRSSSSARSTRNVARCSSGWSTPRRSSGSSSPTACAAASSRR
jgi:PAS domain-containing protein